MSVGELGRKSQREGRSKYLALQDSTSLPASGTPAQAASMFLIRREKFASLEAASGRPSWNRVVRAGFAAEGPGAVRTWRLTPAKTPHLSASGWDRISPRATLRATPSSQASTLGASRRYLSLMTLCWFSVSAILGSLRALGVRSAGF